MRRPAVRRFARVAAALTLVTLGSCISSMLAARRERELQAVDDAVRQFNVALTKGDTVALRYLLRGDFRMIEDSVEYDVESAIGAVAGVTTNGSVARDVSQLKVEQHGTFAWATYKVRGEYVSGRDTLKFSRIEATVLEKIARQWVIAFMTSAPAAP